MSFLTELAQLEREGRAFVVCTVVGTQGSTPQKPGSKLAVVDGGRLVGTIGGGAIEQQVMDAAKALLAAPGAGTRLLETHLTHDLGMCCGGRMTVFLEKHEPAPSLWLFGAGHVGKAVAALAQAVGFAVTVVDERPEWATAERFPGCTVRLEHPADVAKTVRGGAATYVAIATHDHPLDQACVEALLKTPLAFLGVIGSRRKAEKFRQRLVQAGFGDAEVARMESPMGVEIGALTPEEIAVSIVARLVAVRRGNPSVAP